MSEGPYRDLGSGFARLTGAEAPRRAPSPITCVEDALRELLRNSRDAGASSIYIASRLSRRRFRTLTVIDDGTGVPEPFSTSIFEPGVTTRFLAPTRRTPDEKPHGAGLSLHHIKVASVSAALISNSHPTSIQATFDTETIPERTQQTRNVDHRTSNLFSTARTFASETPTTAIYYGSPASILSTLLYNRIIHNESEADVRSGGVGGRGYDRRGLMEEGMRLGLEVSSKTAGRILSGEIGSTGRLDVSGRYGIGGMRASHRASHRASRDAGNPADTNRVGEAHPVLDIGEKDRADIAAILGRVAAASYLELQHIQFKTTGGEIRISARVVEPEDEYG